jgi:hypothetical protein
MLDDAVSASSTWFVGVNPDSDAAHVCSHELVKKLGKRPCKGGWALAMVEPDDERPVRQSNAPACCIPKLVLFIMSRKVS